MLGQLHIKNIGIIDNLTINFEEGLNVLSGETGAGKSLIIDSINAITGGRLSKEMIKQGENMALVEAYFFGEEDIILSREFYPNGRSICKINGNMATLSKFREMGESLVDIHGQHDNQSLLNAKTHLSLLDGFAGASLISLMQKYHLLYEEYQNIKQQINKSYGDPIERARRLDLLKYQNEEILATNLKIGEEEILNQKRSHMMNAEKISKSLANCQVLVENSSIESLEKAIQEINHIASLGERYDTILKSLNDAYYTLKDASYELSSCLEEDNFDEYSQREIEERLDIIFSLKRKYGRDIESILKYQQTIEEEISFLENSDEIVSKLNQKLEETKLKLLELAIQIRKVRIKTAKTVEKKINHELEELEMKNAFIEFDFKETEHFMENGMDDVQILISTNVGEGLKSLSKIASGGEISRVMLAIKSVLCAFDNVPTMIFDEIDTGISGQAANSVADKMKHIGKTHQVICVTHLPTIAASGDVNFFIEKVVQSGRTKTRVTKLSEEGTVNEIARILAGKDITKAVLAHAKEMRKVV